MMISFICRNKVPAGKITSRTSISSNAPEIVLKSVFKKYDIHGSGRLDRNAFSQILEDLGIEDEIEQHAIFALADTNNTKTLTFQEFINLIQSNDFEGILSNQDDYMFVIETYQNFLEFDTDGSGEISWNEFYFYLTKHGYSHEYISNYWHYIGHNSTGTISFEQFWKAFRAQSEAYKVRILHQQINQQITLFGGMEAEEPDTPSVSTTKKRKTIVDKDALIQAVKKKLKPTKLKKSAYKSKVGRVLDASDEELVEESEQKLELAKLNSSSISNWVMERDLDEYSDVEMDELENESTSISESDESLDSLDSDDEIEVSIKKPASAPVTPNIGNVRDSNKKIEENMNSITDAMNAIGNGSDGKQKSPRHLEVMDTNKVNGKVVKSDRKSVQKTVEKKGEIGKKESKSKTPKVDKNIENVNEKKDKNIAKIEKKQSKSKTANVVNDDVKMDEVVKDKKQTKSKTPKTSKIGKNDDEKENVEMDKSMSNKNDNISKSKTPKTAKTKKSKSKTPMSSKSDKKSKSKTPKTAKTNKNVTNKNENNQKDNISIDSDKKENIETDKVISSIQSKTKTLKIVKDSQSNIIRKKDKPKTPKSPKTPKTPKTAKSPKSSKDKKVKTPKSPKTPKTQNVEPKTTKSPKTPKTPRNIPFTEKKDRKYDEIETSSMDKNIKPERDSIKIKIDQLPKNNTIKKDKKIIQKEQKEQNVKPKPKPKSQQKHIRKKNFKKSKSELPKVKKSDNKSRAKQQRQKDIHMAKERLGKRLSLKLGTKIDLNAPKKKPKKLKTIEEPKKKKNKIPKKLPKPKLLNNKSHPVTPTEKETVEKETLTKKVGLLTMSSSAEIDGKSVVANPVSPIVNKKQKIKKYHTKNNKPKSKRNIIKSKTIDDKLPVKSTKLTKTKSHDSLRAGKRRSSKKTRTEKRSSKKMRTEKRSSAKKKTRHVKQPTFGMGFTLFGALRKQDQTIKMEKKKKEQQIRRQSQLILGKKLNLKKKKPAADAKNINHIRMKSQEINSMIGLIDFKPNARSQKYIFRHLHDKTNRFVPADSSKWDRNWDKIYKQREKIRKLKQKKKLDKLKDFNTLQKERNAKIEEANHAFIDPHYKLPIYAAYAGHWDRDWDKINESRKEIDALKKKKKEDKKKDFKTLQKEKQEKINEINKAFINPHYKLPVYAAYAGHWDKDWDKIHKRRLEIELLKRKKKEDKKKDKKTLLAEKHAKASEANQAFIVPHERLGRKQAANKSNWDRDWDKINKAREEIRKLKEKQREKKRELMLDDRSRSVTPSHHLKKNKSKQKVVARSQHKRIFSFTTDDIKRTPKSKIHKKKSSNLSINKKYENIKLKHKDFMAWINENELQSVVNVFIDYQMYEMELISVKSVDFTKLMADDRIVKKMEMRRKIISAIRKLDEKNKEIETQRRERKKNSKKVKFDVDATFFSLEDSDTKSNDESEPTMFTFDAAIERQRSAAVGIEPSKENVKKQKSVRTIMHLDQKNKDHKTIINEARNNLEDFMIKYRFLQIPFFLILVEYGINKPNDLDDLAKSERKEIIKVIGIENAPVKR